MLVQVAGQLCAECESSHSCGQVDDALVGSKVPGPKQLRGATGHQGPVGSKHQAGHHCQRQEKLQACDGDETVDHSCADGHAEQDCCPA